MYRTGTAVFALVVLGLAALAGWLLLGSEGSVLDAPDGVVAEAPTGVDTIDSAIADAAVRDRGAVEPQPGRRKVVPRSEEEGDPDIRAALAGFEGRIVDSERTPVPDSLVQMFRFAADVVINPGVGVLVGDTLAEPDIDAGEVRTDTEGRFRLTGVWPRAFYLLKAGVDTDSQTLKIVQRTPNPGEIVDLGDIVLETLGVLTGTVVDQDGEPVAGALVRAVDLPGTALAMFPAERFDPEGGIIVTEDANVVLVAPPWVKRRFDQLPIASTESGADGSFRLAGVIPGNNLVAVTRRGLLANVRPRVVVKAGEEKDLGDVRMREGEAAFGKVVDDQDRPIEGAQVLVAAETPSLPVHFASFAEPTDQDGVFEMPGIPPGNVLVAARRGPGQPWQLADAQPVTKDVLIRLDSRHAMTITLRSNAGLPVSEPNFQLNPGERRHAAISFPMWGVVRPVDLDGRVEPLKDGRFKISDVPKGHYVLLTTADGHALTALDVDLQRDLELEVTLEGRSVFEVRVANSKGEPVRKAAIYAEARGDGPRLPDAPTHVGLTDRQGKLTVDKVNAKQVRLTASHPAYGSVHAETDLPPAAPIVLTLEDPGSIEGILLEEGQPAIPGKWFVFANRRWDRSARGAMPDMPRMTTADIEGRFVLRGLRPGEYEVGVQQSLEALNSPGRMMDFMMQAFMMQQRDEQTVQVVSNQTAHVTLDAIKGNEITGPSALVTGTVMVDGVPGAGKVIQGWGEGRRVVAEVDRAGRFELGRVKVGHLSLNLMEKPEGDPFSNRRWESMWSRSFQIEDGKDLDLTIEVDLSKLSGYARLPDGAPAKNARVRLNGVIVEKTDKGERRNHVHFTTQTDARGTFAFEKIPAATYTVTVEMENNGRGRVEGVEVAAGIPTTDLEVQLRGVVVVKGHVDVAAFAPHKPQWMWMRFRSIDADGKPTGNDEWVGIDGDDGSFQTDELIAGRYSVRFQLGGENLQIPDGQEYVVESPLTIGAQAVEGLMLRPVLRERDRRD